ncbi:MAG TPA: DUF5946 family protein [Candidatus Angelobacter sp.]|nr:DUF5946 family protein [Candidatus Angelobacter sp.]
MNQEVLTPCPGCGAEFPGPAGIPHPYIGASSGCWSVYEEILAKEYEEYQYPDIHRLTVDAYAVQHPGVPGRRSSQSVWVHLAGMYLVLESGAKGREATRVLQAVIKQRKEFEWLSPPEKNGSITVLDVRKAGDLKSHIQLVEAWAQSIWAAWRQHHRLIADLFLGRAKAR